MGSTKDIKPTTSDPMVTKKQASDFSKNATKGDYDNRSDKQVNADAVTNLKNVQGQVKNSNGDIYSYEEVSDNWKKWKCSFGAVPKFGADPIPDNPRRVFCKHLPKKKKSKKEGENPGSSVFYGPVGYLVGYADVGDKPTTLLEQELKDMGKDVSPKPQTAYHTTAIKPPKLKHFLDQDSNNFRYAEHDLEDPTYLGFDIYIDNEGSPLFNGRILNFARLYSNALIDDISNRFGYLGLGDVNIENSTYHRFYSKFFEIFHKLQETQIVNGVLTADSNGVNSKQYYINKIAGMNLFHKPFIEYGKDKITVTLSEDLKMRAAYLAQLYNTLVYSYNKGREVIPRNLQRFNMIIKVSDIRQLKDQWDNTTRGSILYYTLYDCRLDFMASKNVGDEITNGGFSAGANNTPASLEFDIYFKTVGVSITPPVFDPDTKVYTRDDVGPGGNIGEHIQFLEDEYGRQSIYPTDPEPEENVDYELRLNNAAVNPETQKKMKQNTLTAINQFGDGIVKIGKNAIKGVGNAIVSNLEDKRKKLLNSLMVEVDKIVDLRAKQREKEIAAMGNVYTGNFRDKCLEKQMKGENLGLECFAKDVKKDITAGLGSSITEAKNLAFGTVDTITSVSKLTKLFG